MLVYSRDLWVQRVQRGAANGVKVPISTVARAPTGLGVTCLQGAQWGLFPVSVGTPSSPVSCSPPGLAIMMQLARELKMLAKEFSLAVVVSVAAP